MADYIPGTGGGVGLEGGSGGAGGDGGVGGDGGDFFLLIIKITIPTAATTKIIESKVINLIIIVKRPFYLYFPSINKACQLFYIYLLRPLLSKLAH